MVGSVPRASWGLLRTPVFSFASLGVAWRRINAALDAPFVREALALAAPELLERWVKAEERTRRELAPALARFLVRMSSRPTPFGLFATVSVGSVGSRTHLELAPLETARRKSRLDMEVLTAAAYSLAQDPDLVWRLRFVPNNSIYGGEESLRYFEAHVDKGERRYTLEEVETSPYLRLVIDLATKKATGAELTTALCRADTEIDRMEAEAFVRELIEEQILVPAFEPAVTGEDALASMLGALGSTAEDHPLVVALKTCRRELAEMDRDGVGIDPDRYDRMHQRLKDVGLDVKREHLVQVDLFRPAEVNIGKGVIREVLRAVDLLHRITPSAEPEELRRFREGFAERYGEQMVPLLEVLDEESGIGFGGSPAEGQLLQGVPLGEKTRTTTNVDLERHAALLALVERAWRERATEVELGADDLERLATPDPPPLPDAFAVIASIAAENEEAIDRGRFKVLIKSVGGPSGANLLGRFCHLDGDLERVVRKHLAAEEALRPNAVFARARWMIGEKEIAAFRKADAGKRAEIVGRWRRVRWMPRFVLLADGDNELLVDLEDAAALDMLADTLKGLRRAELVEMFPGPSELCVKGPDGPYTHEIIIPFVREGAADTNPAVRAVGRRHKAARRTFLPGSEWLFAKLYCGQMTADQLLIETLAPLTTLLRTRNLIDGWFFIRYADPDHHLRIRFHGDPGVLWAEVQKLLNTEAKKWLARGLIRRLAYDTYEREIERYGGDMTISLCETLFQYDSEAVLELIRLTGWRDERGERWKLALMGIDRMLVDFGYKMARRAELMAKLRDGFVAEVGGGRAFKKAVAGKLRAERKGLEVLLAGEPREGVFREAAGVLARRSKRWAGSLRKIQAIASEGKLSVSLDDLIGSLIHMHCNRLFASFQRRREAVLYDMLAQLYRSLAAREQSRMTSKRG